MKPAPDAEALRYLDAVHVMYPNGTLAGVQICTGNDEPLGAIGGVLLEPLQRRVRYFVIERSAMLKKRRYLVPADRDAILDTDNRTIQIDSDDELIERFDPESVRRFSDEDLVDTIFSSSSSLSSPA